LQILAVLPGRWAVLAARRSGETKRDIEPLVGWANVSESRGG